MATVLICFILSHFAPDLPSEQGVTIAPKSHQIGAIGHGETRAFVFSVTNSSDSPVSIKKVKASCGCMTVNFKSRSPLASGETREGNCTVRFGRGWGNFNKFIEVQHDGQGPPLKVGVTADYHPGISAKPMEIVLAGVHNKAIPDATRSLSLKASSPASDTPRVEVTAIEGKHLSARVVEISTTEVQVEVTVAPEHPKGRVLGKVKGIVNDLPFEIPVRGEVYGAVRWTPSTLNLGQVIGPGLCDSTLVLESTTGKKLSIRDIEVKLLPRSSQVQIDAAVEPVEGGKARIRLAIGDPFPTKVGSIRAQLTIRTNQQEEPIVIVSVLGVARPDRAEKKVTQ